METIEKLTKEGIRSIPPYIPGNTSESVKEKYHLDHVLKLASNENQYGCSPKALEAMGKAVAEANIYPDPFCIGLRRKLGRKFGFDDSGDNVIISAGASGILLLLGEVFVCDGDEVVFCEPTFGAYASAATRNNGKAVACPLTPDQKFDLEAMKAAVTDRTKLVFICNPNNPTGTAVDSSELRAFIRSMPKHVITVVDEAYIEFATDPAVESMISEIDEDTNLIVVRTFSKIYGLAGERIGYSLMNKKLHAILQKATSVFVVGRTSLAGAMAALDDDSFLASTRAGIREGREYLPRELPALGWKVWESHTNFLYADSRLDTKALAAELEKKGLIIRGNFRYSRITVGTMEQNREMIDIIKATIAEGSVSPAQP